MSTQSPRTIVRAAVPISQLTFVTLSECVMSCHVMSQRVRATIQLRSCVCVALWHAYLPNMYMLCV